MRDVMRVLLVASCLGVAAFAGIIGWGIYVGQADVFVTRHLQPVLRHDIKVRNLRDVRPQGWVGGVCGEVEVGPRNAPDWRQFYVVHVPTNIRAVVEWVNGDPYDIRLICAPENQRSAP